MEGKKISFGFMKTKKAEKPIEEKKEYIDCIDEKSIKVIGGEVVKDDIPLVIPMKPNTLVTPERLKQIAEEVEKAVEEAPKPGDTVEQSPEKNTNVNDNESLEQMAVRELLNEAKKETKVEMSALTVPVLSHPVLEGERESTLDDYEAVPIQEFGMAMLRGMGWTPSKEQSKYKEPELRPKGLGLGADKVIKENQKKNKSKDNEDLSIVKNAFVKITTGKYSGCYGKVVSLDEDNGRVMVDIPIKKEMVSLSEFMMQPVTKPEFDKEFRVINADTYEEYKKSEQSSQKSSKHSSPKITERDASSSQNYSDYNKDKKERETGSSSKKVDNSNGRKSRSRDRSEERDSSSDDRSKKRKKSKKRYSSNDSESSDYEKQRKHKRDTKHRSSTDSESDLHYKKYKKSKRKKSKTSKEKRDIDKKRKGKKKKRDKDLSPNYKKCRK